MAVLALAATLLITPGCLVRRQTRVQPSQLPPPALEATLDNLVARLNSTSESVRTLTATVELEATAGSIYSGVIKEYQDINGFILIQGPSMIRILGQAPVVRTNIFDMVSNGEDFRLNIPPRQKFIVGKANFRRPAKNALENLRPQHILEALLVPPLDASHEKWFLEEAEDGGHRFYVVTVVDLAHDELRLERKAWFDRAKLELARMQFYESDGVYIEDVHYSAYQDFQGISYPSHIEVRRPIEDYHLAITLLKATFNQPIEPQKFILNKPEGAQLVDLDTKAEQEKPRDQ